MAAPGVKSVITLLSRSPLPRRAPPKTNLRAAPNAKAKTIPTVPAGPASPPQPPFIGPGPMPGPMGPPSPPLEYVGYPQLPPELSQVPISFPFGGKPNNYAMVNVPMAFALTVPVNLVGAKAYAGTQAAGNPVFTLNKISGGVVTQLGTVTILSGDSIIGPPGEIISVLGGPGGALDIGDVLQMVAPVQDAALADVGITILTMRV
jgi:hypothetical protein